MQESQKTSAQLASELADVSSRLSELQARLDQASVVMQRLHLVNSLKEGLLRSAGLNEKLKLITDGVVKIFSADFARIWIVKPGDRCEVGCMHARLTDDTHACHYRDRCLHLVASSGRYTHTNGDIHSRVPLDGYKIGRIASGSETSFRINDVVNSSLIHDPNWARSVGLVSAAGHRIQTGSGDTLGVLALFSKFSFTDDDEFLLESIAKTTAQVFQTSMVEEALNEERQRFRRLAENSPFGTVMIEKDGKFSYANPKFTKMFGYDLSDVPDGKHWLRKAYPDPDQRREVLSAWLDDINGTAHGETRPRVYNVTCKDGSQKIVHFRPVKLNSGSDLMTLEDITQRKRSEVALSRSRQDLEDIFEAIGHPTIIMDKEHRILSANRATIAATGKSLNELVGSKCYEIFHKTVEPVPNCPMQALLKRDSSELAAVETEMGALDRHFLVSCTPLLDKDGAVEKIIHIATDVSERKRAEDEVRLNEARLEKIVEILHFKAHSVDEFMDYALAEAIELTQSKIGYIYNYDEDTQEFGISAWSREVMKECSATEPEIPYNIEKTGIWGEAVRQRKPILINDFQAPHPLKKGYPEGHAALQRYLTAPVFDGDRIVAVVGVANKESEYTQTDTLQLTLLMDSVWKALVRLKSEERLRESEEKYRSLFEDSIDGIFSASTDGTLFDANQSFLDLFGYRKNEMLGANIIRLYSNVDDWMRFQMEIVKDGAIRDYPSKLLKRDGKKIDCLITATVRKDAHGTILGYRGIIRDVTEQKSTEEALLNEKEFTDRLIDSLPGVFYLFDAEGSFLRWNKNFETVSGRSTREIETTDPLDVIAPEHKQLVNRAIGRTFEAGEMTVEAHFAAKDGTSTPYLFTGKSINFGPKPCIVGMGLDISAQKRTEENLRQKTEMLRSMFQASPEAIVVLDPQGVVKMWNASAERIFGWTESEAVGRINPIVPEAKYDEFRMLRERVLNGESFSGVELTRHRKDGSVVEISVSTAPLIGPDGSVEAIFSLNADITERKRSEEGRRLLATAVEQSIEAVMIRDRNGVIQYVNHAFERISGYSREEVIGKDTRFLKSDRYDISHYEEPFEAIKKGRSWKGRLVAQKKNGQIFYEDVAISPVRNSAGEIVNFVDVAHDVTEPVELQKQLIQAQKMEAIGTLAGGIAHDFNNLLQAVLGYSELMLQRKKEGEKDYSDLQTIRHAGQRGADLVRGLLTFSQKVETEYVCCRLEQGNIRGSATAFSHYPQDNKN